MSYRRGIVRSVYDKMQNDERLRTLDKGKWYQVNREALEKASLSNFITCTNPANDYSYLANQNYLWTKFEQFHVDTETENFLEACHEQSDNICWQIWISVATTLLRWFVTQTSLNGFLGRGSMQVYSSSQFKQLVNYDGVVLESLLDIGAGDGFTTLNMASCFHKVFTTEMSRPMKSTLRSKGFIVLDELSWSEGDQQFSVISCLNVLDRCDKPLELLGQIKTKLEPNGIAVISFVIPFSPYVEFKTPNNKPTQVLPIAGKSFESEVANFVQHVLEPNGWELVKWTRLPYLCQGDIKQAFYWLNDAVFVIKPK